MILVELIEDPPEAVKKMIKVFLEQYKEDAAMRNSIYRMRLMDLCYFLFFIHYIMNSSYIFCNFNTLINEFD
jgi:hypothetical protein